MLLLLASCVQPTDPSALEGDSSSAADSALTGLDSGEGGSDTGDTGSDGDVDYAETGSHTFSTTTRSVTTSSSCTMQVTLREPTSPTDAVVLVSHGFARSADNMQGWSEHLASHGLTVATPALCHLSIWDSDHVANGADLAALAQELGYAHTVYMGHSAGGLASALAASSDPTAAGVIGLDLTDADGLAASADLSGVPVFGVLGEPSTCNSDGNGASVFGASAVRVVESDHCDFESPSDWVCEVGCPGTNDRFDDDAIQRAIRGLLTAAAMDAAGQGSAQAWWTSGGTFHDALAASGQID